MKINLKKYIPILFISFSIMILFGTSYALLRDSSKGENPYIMKVGLLEISFIDSETNTLSLTNAVPVSDDEGLSQEQELTFTIKNTGTLPALYNTYIEETSTDIEFKNVIRYVSNKNDLGYGEIKTLSLDNYIDYESKLDVGESATYKVKLWLAETADSTYMNKTFTARIVVDVVLGKPKTIAEKLIDKVGTDGLVAITTDGDLYTGEGEIREYRYSGLDVNNYIYFNCTDNDGTYDYGNTNYDYASNCETWRIVGVFEEDSEQVIKIMRNTMLTSDELPATYVVDGTTYTIEETTTGRAYWNYSGTTDNNDWTTAGLQYFLNTDSDSNSTAGYLSTLTTSSEELIRTTTYNLGNVVYDTDTTITSYANERNTASSNLHSGNYGTWSGKVALLYPSDYGYSASNIYWTTAMYNYDTAQDSVVPCDTSWMQVGVNHTMHEWFLSPSSFDSDRAIYWNTTGRVGDNIVNYHRGIRPCLYLESTAQLLIGTGEESSPYVVISD